MMLALLLCLACISIGKENDTPWHVAVENIKPLESGEHPRLLFRRSELPGLRAKAKTAQGKAILRRLRFLLEGKDDETMTTLLRTGEQSQQGAGVYSIGNAGAYSSLTAGRPETTSEGWIYILFEGGKQHRHEGANTSPDWLKATGSTGTSR